MNFILRNIPNSVTCLNIASGMIAIVMASRGFDVIAGLQAWQWACIFIGIGAVADFFDGFCARMLNAYSNLGKELDSLCDLVTFGVAPAVIMWNLIQESGFDIWLAWASLIIPVFGALRLARFNIDTRQTTSFIGLPIPANAIFWIGYAFLIAAGTAPLGSWPVYITILLVECWLMISPVRLFSLKFRTWGWKGNEARYLLIIAAALFIFCLGPSGLMWLILFYVLLSQLPFAKQS